MRRLGDTVAALAAAAKPYGGTPAMGSALGARLRPFAFGGPNPGALDALSFTPRDAAAGALVVVLHGCTQTAEAYDQGAGWSRHAEVEGFSVLYPQQRRANNPGLCFNWFSPDDTARDKGEAASIAAMVAAMVREHDLDPRRVFITGLSAGGAMTAVLLAAYPDLFAAGAVIAGLPYGAASSMPQAFEAMRGQGADPDPDRVRRASPGVKQWPRITIIHGTADHTVDVANADRLLTQWLGVHGVTSGPDTDDGTGRFHHRTWSDISGEIRVEDYRIDGMGHGTPLDIRADPLGAVGPFMLDVGFASTARLTAVWGLGGSRASLPARPEASKPSSPTGARQSASRPVAPARGVQAVIESALRRAGLLP